MALTGAPAFVHAHRRLHQQEPSRLVAGLLGRDHITAGASNGPTEALNLLIEKIRRLGHGYRNFTNYRRRLLLGCGVQWDTVPTRRIRGRQPAFAE
jgi:Transposase